MAKKELLVILIFCILLSGFVSADVKEFALKLNRLELINGDANVDGKVDILDLAVLGLNYGEKETDAGWDWRIDVANTVGEINIFDLAEVGLNYGKNYIQVIDDPVFISPVSRNVLIGDDFSMDVAISTSAEVYALEVILNFDPAILQVSGISEGNFLNKDGASTYPLIEINNETGMIKLANTRLGESVGVSGEGVLATINFDAIKIGTSSVSISSLTLVDSGLNEIPGIPTGDGWVNVTSEIDNLEPTISGLPDKEIDEDTTPASNWIDLYLYSEDNEDADSLLTFRIKSQSNSGLINCRVAGNKYLNCDKPVQDGNGNNQIVIEVLDTGGLSDEDSLLVKVNPINDAPIINSFSPAMSPTIQEKQSQGFSITTSDVDIGDSLTTKWYLNGIEVASGNAYNYTAYCNSQGTYEIKAVVSDGEATAYKIWQLTVLEACTRTQLKAGNNIFSLPINQQKTFNQIDTNCGVVVESRADLAYYQPNLGDLINESNYVFVGLDETLYPGQGYFIKVEHDCYIETSGGSITTRDLGYLGTRQLKIGWNLIGAPTSATGFSAGNCSLFGSIGILKYGYNVASCDNVAGYNGKYEYCTMEKGINRCRCSVDNFEPGLGYWIRTVNECSLA